MSAASRFLQNGLLHIEQRSLDGGSRGLGPLHGKQMAAVQHGDAPAGDALRHLHAHLAHLHRRATADEGHRAAHGVTPELVVEIAGQGVVDGGFHLAPEQQAALALVVLQAVLHIVLQHLRVPLGKRLLAAKVLQRLFVAGPGGAPALADLAGGDRGHDLRLLGQAHGVRLPAAQQGRVDEQHAARQIGAFGGGLKTQNAAQRVAHQIDRLAVSLDLLLDVFDQLVHQMRPVVGDGMQRVVAEALHAAGFDAALAQQRKQQAIGADGKAVGVREDHGQGVGLAGCCSGLGHERRAGYEKRPKGASERRSV